VSAWIVDFEFCTSTVDDDRGARNGDRRFGNVGSENDSLNTIGCWLENLALFGDRCSGMQRMHSILLAIGKVDRQRGSSIFVEKDLGDAFHLLETRQAVMKRHRLLIKVRGSRTSKLTYKTRMSKRVSIASMSVVASKARNVRPTHDQTDGFARHGQQSMLSEGKANRPPFHCRIDSPQPSCQRLDIVEPACPDCARRDVNSPFNCNDKRTYLEYPAPSCIGAALEVTDKVVKIMPRNWIRLSWHIDQWRLPPSVVLEIVSEEVGVDGRAHQQDFGCIQSGFFSGLEHSLQDDQQKICIQISLMHFIQNNVRDRIEPSHLILVRERRLESLEKDTDRHEG
jgi:hypothetical protein